MATGSAAGNGESRPLGDTKPCSVRVDALSAHSRESGNLVVRIRSLTAMVVPRSPLARGRAAKVDSMSSKSALGAALVKKPAHVPCTEKKPRPNQLTRCARHRKNRYLINAARARDQQEENQNANQPHPPHASAHHHVLHHECTSEAPGSDAGAKHVARIAAPLTTAWIAGLTIKMSRVELPALDIAAKIASPRSRCSFIEEG